MHLLPLPHSWRKESTYFFYLGGETLKHPLYGIGSGDHLPAIVEIPEGDLYN